MKKFITAFYPFLIVASFLLFGAAITQINESQVKNLTTDLASKVPTSTTVAGFALSGNVTLASLTATDATLIFSGAYNGSTARTVGIASSVALAGSPTTTTQAALDNSTKIATTSYVDATDYSKNIYKALGSAVFGFPAGTLYLTGQLAMTNQALMLCATYVPVAATITGVRYSLNVNGSYTGNNFNGVALFSYSGGTLTQVAVSSNTAAAWSAGLGWHTLAFTGTYSAAVGTYFIGYLYSESAQTTAPQIGSNTSSGVGMAYDFTNSAKLYGELTSQTTMPSSVTSSSITAIGANVLGFLY